MTETTPVPKAIRSREDLVARGLAEPLPAQIPVQRDGTTYEMAQEVRWLDGENFAVGRWDGSMSIFKFQNGTSGPLITKAVNDPLSFGVHMLTALSNAAFVSSVGPSSIGLWSGKEGWAKLKWLGACKFDPALGSATSGAALGNSLVVGHANGFLSIWEYVPATANLFFKRSVNVQNPNPVNPWNDHMIEDVVVVDAGAAVVAAGSEDGYVTMMNVPSGGILSQTVFNPKAQRGINALAVEQAALLVANCCVGSEDDNLWYYGFDYSDWSITLLASERLVINQSLPQVFNFDVEWGSYNGDPCWFASTEEGALWMGVPEGADLGIIGYQQLTGPLGSALAYQSKKLAMVAYDLYEFTTT